MNKTWLLFRDEMLGFAKSWVMIALWVLMPALGILLYFLLAGATLPGVRPGTEMPSIYLTGLTISSIGSTLASIMLAVDIVNEKNRKVYDLFVIRPIRRGDIMWAKFFAVFICVTVACFLSMSSGLILDVIRGLNITSSVIDDTLVSFISAVGIIAVASAAGVIIGVISNSILIAVLLLLYGAQIFMLVPMIPTYLGMPDILWLTTLLSVVIVIGLMWLSVFAFRKREF